MPSKGENSNLQYKLFKLVLILGTHLLENQEKAYSKKSHNQWSTDFLTKQHQKQRERERGGGVVGGEGGKAR